MLGLYCFISIFKKPQNAMFRRSYYCSYPWDCACVSFIKYHLQLFHHFMWLHLRRSASFLSRCPALGPSCAPSDTLTDTAVDQWESNLVSVSIFLESDWLLGAGPCRLKPWCCQPGRHDSWRRETRRIDENKPPSIINKELVSGDGLVGVRVDEEKVKFDLKLN